MKYVLMYTTRPDLAADVDPETAQAVYKRVYEWFGENAGVMTDSGAELLGVETATTVRHSSDGAVVVDGPFSEAKEVIGGFSVIDVADMDAAIAVVRTWPLLDLPGVAVEIRPMVEDYSQFD
ncbi:MAG TPA: YciI family protein [Nocardioides sp.]|nr:YciI family protein [Nocardioides sp.]